LDGSESPSTQQSAAIHAQTMGSLPHGRLDLTVASCAAQAARCRKTPHWRAFLIHEDTQMRIIFWLGAPVFVSLISAALAESPPVLPASAKKLTGKEIAALYDGATVSFENFTMKSPLTGTDTYDLKAHLHQGTYTLGNKSGAFSGAARVKGNQFCHREGGGPEHCAFVYTDGGEIYEANAKGLVESQNRKH
jgi:hypothetical protein